MSLPARLLFLRNGLMEYGSIFGHGAYLRPDFTADYLHRAALSALAFYGGAGSSSAGLKTVGEFRTNRYDAATDSLAYSPAQTPAFDELQRYYAQLFGEPTTKFGLRPGAIRDPEDISKADGVLQLVGVGGGHHAARENVLI